MESLVPTCCLDCAKKRQEKDAEIEALKTKLNTCKNDYWFMINLIEKYGSNKEKTLKDCLERMKFRKPMFNLSETPNSSKGGSVTVIKHTRYICDVCQTTYYSEQSMTQVNFSYDSYDGKFDCCYDCMRGNEKMRSVYQKIVSIIKLTKNSSKEGM